MLKKCYRLCKRGSFAYVYNKGERRSEGQLALVWVRGKNLRVGVSVPNKVGKAVKRNLIKRRLRAILRTLLPNLKPAQVVVVARVGAQTMTFGQMETTLKALFARAKLLEQSS